MRIDQTLYRGRADEGRLDKERRCYDLLDGLGIEYFRVDHEHADTIEACREVENLLGCVICKNLFLCNRQQTEFYLYVTSADKPFVTRDFCSALGIPRVSFASADLLWEKTGVLVGATTILSAVLPQAALIHLVMDQDVADAPWFACTDGTATCFVKLRTRDLLDKYLSGQSVRFL